MNKFKTLLIFLCFVPLLSLSQVDSIKVNSYFKSIQKNRAKLRQFFQHMPKGADLHHHYSGSVYAETYMAYIEKEDFWINRETLEYRAYGPPELGRDRWSRISSLKQDGYWRDIKREIIKIWSVQYYEYNFENLPSDEHFFRTFDNFGLAKDETYEIGLKEIKHRAKIENVSYIETMFRRPKIKVSLADEADYVSALREIQKEARQNPQENEQYAKQAQSLLKKWCKAFENNFKKDIDEVVQSFNGQIKTWHESFELDDEDFKLRYQNYAIRVTDPAHVFKHVYICFESVKQSPRSDKFQKDPLIVGVNFVAPEHYDNSMNDYWIHMQIFKFFRGLYKDVSLSLHAGELMVGLVKPEELTWHIQEAVNQAGAQRIGHGVDIMYEDRAILEVMKEKNTAVEINLSSNEFILGIPVAEHPFTIYEQVGVPLVISTDDAGILRTDLTEQYVLLAFHHPDLNWYQIKQFNLNGVSFSFLENKAKAVLLESLQKEMKAFEEEIAKQW